MLTSVDVKGNNPCAVCGEHRPEKFRIWFDSYLKLYRCATCGFVAQYPGPGGDLVMTDYSHAYTLGFLEAGHEFMYPQRRRVLQDIVNRIKTHTPKGDLLDIGCGDGHLLYLAHKAGLSPHGVEDCDTLAKFAAQKANANVICGRYHRDMFPEASFDAISLVQVLEHIPTPAETLKTVLYHLRPGGTLLVEVPSITSPHFLAYRMTGVKWFARPPGGVIPSHCGYYAPKVLQGLAEVCGFHTKSVVTGRWQYKYSGAIRTIGAILDPVFNALGVGGILYIGQKPK